MATIPATMMMIDDANDDADDNGLGNKQARKLQARLEGPHSLTDSLTGVKCRATSVAKNKQRHNSHKMSSGHIQRSC